MKIPPVVCRYCLEPWVAGGKYHKPDCPILTGNTDTKLKKKPKPKKATKYGTVHGLPDNSPRVEPMDLTKVKGD